MRQSGNVTWSGYKDQALKDIQIIKDKLSDKIDRIEWHCFGEVDNSFIENVQKELLNNGLKAEDFIIIKY